METQKGRKGGGSKLTRTQTVTVRLDPKLRYLAELAARKHRRTLSSFIEWAIEESLNQILIREGSGYNNDHGVNLSDEAEHLWDVDDADRFAKLAINFPEMLNLDEQRIWKLVKENGYLWKGSTKSRQWIWKVSEEHFIFARLRKYWEEFQAVAADEADPSILPKWSSDTTTKIDDSSESKFAEDDIPF